ncbi:MAG TPA: KH domain-containing protein [bacterium]|nr:KH domain-containing protein [bacterium]
MNDSKAVKIVESLTNEILDKLEMKPEELDISVEVGDDEEVKYVSVVAKGEDLGDLIGYHGKTLEALQTLLGLVVGKESDREYRVLLDVNEYKERRKEYLTSLAYRAVDQVKEANQEMELEPMKPFERRIIHMALKEEDGIETGSVGEGDERRVVIKVV